MKKAVATTLLLLLCLGVHPALAEKDVLSDYEQEKYAMFIAPLILNGVTDYTGSELPDISHDGDTTILTYDPNEYTTFSFHHVNSQTTKATLFVTEDPSGNAGHLRAILGFLGAFVVDEGIEDFDSVMDFASNLMAKPEEYALGDLVYICEFDGNGGSLFTITGF